jgi:hypothetical protein
MAHAPCSLVHKAADKPLFEDSAERVIEKFGAGEGCDLAKLVAGDSYGLLFERDRTCRKKRDQGQRWGEGDKKGRPLHLPLNLNGDMTIVLRKIAQRILA